MTEPEIAGLGFGYSGCARSATALGLPVDVSSCTIRVARLAPLWVTDRHNSAAIISGSRTRLAARARVGEAAGDVSNMEPPKPASRARVLATRPLSSILLCRRLATRAPNESQDT